MVLCLAGCWQQGDLAVPCFIRSPKPCAGDAVANAGVTECVFTGHAVGAGFAAGRLADNFGNCIIFQHDREGAGAAEGAVADLTVYCFWEKEGQLAVVDKLFAATDMFGSAVGVAAHFVSVEEIHISILYKFIDYLGASTHVTA